MFFTKRRARAALIAGVASATLLLTSCSGGDSSTSGTDEGTSSETSVAEGQQFIYITSDPIGQNAFLQSGEAGIESIAAEFKGKPKTYESKDDTTRRSNLEAAVSEAPAVIVMLGFQFGDMAKEVAEQNPQQKFVLIDTEVEGAPDNLYQATFREYEPSYLLGIEAGMLTEKDKVGAVVSLDNPLLKKYWAGFNEGAKSVNDSVETLNPVFIGGENPFADTARAKEAAIGYSDNGADHIFAVGAAANGGIFEAAQSQGFSTYGTDANQCPDAPGVVVDGTVKAVDQVVETIVREILEGKSTDEATSSFGLKEGGMNIVSLTDEAADSQCTVMEHQDVLDAITQARDEIVSGDLVLADPSAE